MPLTDAPIIRALSVRQPYAEQILRGTKRLEYRSTNSNIRERVWIYASLQDADDPAEWRKMGTPLGGLTNGRIIGSVVITDSIEQDDGGYAWKLADPKRLNEPLEVTNHPQPGIWRPVFKHATETARKFEPAAEPFAKAGKAAKKSARTTHGSTTAITGELICYHNPEKMETEIWEVGGDGEFGAYCARRYSGAEGKRVWFVTGRDRPRRYYLGGWFRVDTVKEIHPEPGVTDHIYRGRSGEVGRSLEGLVEIGRASWFKDLQRACANFATMQHVRDVRLLKRLEEAWQDRRTMVRS